MIRALPALLALLTTFAQPAPAQDLERGMLGFGRLFSNDAIGDGRDRWHTGSYVFSLMRGPGWEGTLPDRVGAMLEYRLRADVIAPEDAANPAAGDRRYAGTLSLGIHTYFNLHGIETRLGFDLVGTGPSTGIGHTQKSLHQLLNQPEPDLSNQIANGIHPTVSAEFGRTFSVGNAALRPFVELQAGAETLVRAGGDVTIGRFGQGALMVRDVTTGQRYPGIRGETGPESSFIVGADVAYVFDSIYLPSSGDAQLTDTRTRLRAGVNWQGERGSLFYGLTWLGKEFEGQADTQLLGSIRIGIQF